MIPFHLELRLELLENVRRTIPRELIKDCERFCLHMSAHELVGCIFYNSLLSRARVTPVNFLFEKKGLVRFLLNLDDQHEAQFEFIWNAASEAGAEDFEEYNIEDSSHKEFKVFFIQIFAIKKSFIWFS